MKLVRWQWERARLMWPQLNYQYDGVGRECHTISCCFVSKGRSFLQWGHEHASPLLCKLNYHWFPWSPKYLVTCNPALIALPHPIPHPPWLIYWLNSGTASALPTLHKWWCNITSHSPMLGEGELAPLRLFSLWLSLTSPCSSCAILLSSPRSLFLSLKPSTDIFRPSSPSLFSASFSFLISSSASSRSCVRRLLFRNSCTLFGLEWEEEDQRGKEFI